MYVYTYVKVPGGRRRHRPLQGHVDRQWTNPSHCYRTSHTYIYVPLYPGYGLINFYMGVPIRRNNRHAIRIPNPERKSVEVARFLYINQNDDDFVRIETSRVDLFCKKIRVVNQFGRNRISRDFFLIKKSQVSVGFPTIISYQLHFVSKDTFFWCINCPKSWHGYWAARKTGKLSLVPISFIILYVGCNVFFIFLLHNNLCSKNNKAELRMLGNIKKNNRSYYEFGNHNMVVQQYILISRIIKCV